MSDVLNVNFFKPRSSHAREDMRLILTLFIIWAVAVFGFQVLLILLNKDTPEPAYTSYLTVKDKVMNGSATIEEQQTFSRSLLSVLGKNIALTPEHSAQLKKALSASIINMLPIEEQSDFQAKLQSAKETKDYSSVAEEASMLIGLENSGFDKIMRSLLPTSLVMVEDLKADPGLAETMELYLVHNQSALTDFRFLGFPFHYWYTGQFLLILFVVLCLIYAYRTDKNNKKHNFEDR